MNARPLLDPWKRLVSAAPKATILLDPNGKTFSRKQLDLASDQLASEWTTQGLEKQRILSLHLPHGFDWFAAFLAGLKCGVIIAPFDPSQNFKEAKSAAIELRSQAIWNGDELFFPSDQRPRLFRQTDLTVAKLTSGSTGTPKPLFFTARQMRSDGENLIKGMGIRKKDINLGIIPWSHSYGLGNIVIPLLLQGTATTWSESPLPSDIANACQAAKATIFPAVPTLLRILCQSESDTDALSSLRLVISAGARLSPEIANAFKDRFNLIPRNFYGSTETGGVCYDASGEASLNGRSIGKPLPGVTIQIKSRNRFYVSSKAVFTYGRQRRNEKIGSQLMPDYGCLNDFGELVLQQRAKGLLKVGGRRVNPTAIERKLESIKGVSQAIVFTVERNQDAILVAALETRRSKSKLTPLIQSLLSLRERPKSVKRFPRFPTTSRGKVDLRQIRSAFEKPNA